MLKLWLWKHFVDGRPEYWAFDNPYPCHPSGDPITLGEPCGYALFKESENARPEQTDEQVLEKIARARTPGRDERVAFILFDFLKENTAAPERVREYVDAITKQFEPHRRREPV